MFYLKALNQKTIDSKCHGKSFVSNNSRCQNFEKEYRAINKQLVYYILP